LISVSSSLLDNDNARISQTNSGGTLRTGDKIARCWQTSCAIVAFPGQSRDDSLQIIDLGAQCVDQTLSI
jgi:hypothetical protein